jgi:hypothetical protein
MVNKVAKETETQQDGCTGFTNVRGSVIGLSPDGYGGPLSIRSMSLDHGQAEPNSSGSMVLAYGAAEQDARAQGCSEAEAVLCEPQGTLSSAPGSQRLTLLCSTCFLYDHFICY